MKIEFDKEADAVYIELNAGEFATNKKIDSNTVIDLDKNGKILGIEIVNASKAISKDFLSNVSFQNLV
jgi:uncharacterized protein YuzE